MKKGEVIKDKVPGEIINIFLSSLSSEANLSLFLLSIFLFSNSIDSRIRLNLLLS